MPNSLDLDTSMANMLLVETLAKLRAEQEEHMAMAQKGFMLDDACKAREKQIQSAQLIIKFKESALVSYRKGVTSAAMEAEKGALQEEVAQLRKQLDFHPGMLSNYLGWIIYYSISTGCCLNVNYPTRFLLLCL